MKNSYGNYVIQKALKLSNGHFKVKITNNIKKCLDKITDKKLINKWTNILDNLKTTSLHLDINSKNVGVSRKKSDDSMISNNSNGSFKGNNSINSNNSFQSNNSFHSSNNDNFINRPIFSNFNFTNLSYNNVNNNPGNFGNFNSRNYIINQQPNDMNILPNQNQHNELFSPQFTEFISRSAENSPNVSIRMINHNSINRFKYYKKKNDNN